MHWENEPVDHFNDYVDRFAMTQRGTLMPPTPGVSEYEFMGEYNTDDGKVYYRFVPKYRPEFINLVNFLVNDNPSQIVHRSRVAAVACSPLRIPELLRKDEGRVKYGKELDRYKLNESQSRQLLTMILTTTFKYMKVDMVHIARYLKDHEQSSVGMGYKWPDLACLEEEDWERLRSLLIEKYSRLLGEDYGKYYTLPYNMGIRARSEQLPSLGLDSGYAMVVERARIVSFLFEFSSIAVFLVDKVGWYTEIMSAACRMFGVDMSLLSLPVCNGGQVYVDASKWLCQGDILHAYDGKQFETAVGIILGTAFRGLMLSSHGLMEGSGITFTTLFNTVCMIRIYSILVNGYKAIILGDDLNVFTESETRPFKGEGFVEYQPEDTEVQFILGVAYARDPKMPRIQGIKLTVDNGGKAIPYDFEYPKSLHVNGHHEERTIQLWYGMHLGYFGKTSLVKAISGIAAADFRGPGEMLQSLPESEREKVGMSEAQYAMDTYGLV